MKVAFRLFWTGVALGASLVTTTAVSISSFTPEYGSAGMPSYVTINGSGFSASGTLSVRFNGVLSTEAAATTDTTILATVPPAATTGKISVQIGSGTPAFSLKNFVVVGAGPYIHSFSPSNGGPGTVVTLEGMHFTGVNSVKFNGTNTLVFNALMGDTTMQAEAPANVTTGPITVSNPQGSWTSSNIFYAPPVVTAFFPTSGRVGTNVMIAGRNFTGATAVTFNGVSSQAFTVNSPTQMVATVPTNATTGIVFVETPAGSFPTSSNFVVLPVLYGFSPGFGPAGTVVTLSGAAFASNTIVRFNGIAAGIVSNITYSSLKAVVPSATTGPVSITTTNGSYTNFTLFYFPAAISSFTPTNSPPGSLVKITGQNFLDASAVDFGGVPAASFIISNNTTIGATVPEGVITGPLRVTTPAGSFSSAGRFFGLPLITGFNPTHGLPGTNVTISGTNFLNASAVRFNDVDATGVTVVNNGTILATVPNGAQTGYIKVVAPAGTNSSATKFALDYTSDLSITMTDSPDPAFVNAPITYTMTVINKGPFPASDVLITNIIPPGMARSGNPTTTHGTIETNANEVIFHAGMISNNTVVLTLPLAALNSGNVTNWVSVNSDYPDPALTNNQASATTAILPLARLSIRKPTIDRIRVYWPLALSNYYFLQYRDALGTANAWSNITTIPTVSGTDLMVTETNYGTPRFYRLRQ